MRRSSTTTGYDAGNTIIQSDVIGSSSTDKWFIVVDGSALQFNLHSGGGNAIATFPTASHRWYHVEIYDVRLVATDGFERTAQEFKLFSRAGVKILSQASKSASVGKKYNYPVKVWRQKPDEKINYIYKENEKNFTKT